MNWTGKRIRNFVKECKMILIVHQFGHPTPRQFFSCGVYRGDAFAHAERHNKQGPRAAKEKTVR